MAYFPRLAKATPCRRYTFDAYRAVLLNDIESAQTVQYHYVFMVLRGDVPCLAVASEYSSEESKAEPFLGVFPGEMHLNYRSSTDWLDCDKFAHKALEVALKHLGLPEGTPVDVEMPKTSIFGKIIDKILH